MGFQVNGFCHATDVEARVHFYDLYFTFGMDRTTDQFGLMTPGSTGPAAGFVRPTFSIISSNSAGTAMPFPTCDVSLEGGFMPWASGPSSGGGSFLDFELGPELTAELILAAGMIYAIAWCCRVGRGLA